MALLEIENLTLPADGRNILDGLSLELWEGYVHAIVGPNGAGKSTLAYTIMGLEDYRRATGEIRFADQRITDLDVDRRARLGMTLGWQEPARFEGLRVQTFVRISAKDKSDDAIDGILDSVGLDPSRYRDRAVDTTLSGGERKKVELASIVAMKPRLVILDEPDSGIDVESLHRIADAIGVLKEHGSTVLLITHSEEVLSWAEHAFLMCDGRVLDKGVTADVKQYFLQRCIPCKHPNVPDEDALAASQSGANA